MKSDTKQEIKFVIICMTLALVSTIVFILIMGI